MALRDDVLAALADQDTTYRAVLARTLAAAERVTGRAFAAWPAHLSPIPEDTDLTPYLLGLQLLDEPVPPTPQGAMVAGVILARHPSRVTTAGEAAPLYSSVTVQLGRRGAKTTSIEATLLGLCETRDRTTVTSTAQDGTRASQFMRARLMAYENRLPIREDRNTTDAQRLATIGLRELYKSQGREYLLWSNRSRWQCVKPESGAVRGAAADLLWFDEGGELDPITSGDLVAGALPLLDTRPMGQAIISGTPSETGREGMFWDYLTRARGGEHERAGVVDFAAPDYSDPTDEALWWAHHPGLAAGMTTVEVLRERLGVMDLGKFAREYLCVWPVSATTTALDPEKYDAGEVPALVAPPAGARWALAFDCDLEGRSASIVASIVHEDGRVYSQVMDHRPGTSWVARELAAAVRAHPRVRIGYDPIGANMAVAQEVNSMPRGARRNMQPMPLREVAAGASLISQRLEVGAWEHGPSKALDLAADGAAWRNSGDSRLFRRTSASTDISALIAASESGHLAAGLTQTPAAGEERRHVGAALG